MYIGYSQREKDLAISLYKKGKTLKYITKIIGVSSSSLSEWLKNVPKVSKCGPPKGNIPWNKDKSHPSAIGNKFAVKKKVKRNTSYYRARKIVGKIMPCKMCNKIKSKFNMIVHHIDENPFNNKLSNLMRLCRTCHINLHRNNHDNPRTKNNIK